MFHSHSTLAIIIASGAAISAVALPLLLDSAVPAITEIQAIPGREKGDSKALLLFDMKELQGLDDEENTPHYIQVPHTVIADSVSIMAVVIPESHEHHNKVHEKKNSLASNVVKDPSLVYVKRGSTDTMSFSAAEEYLNSLDPNLKGMLANLFKQLGTRRQEKLGYHATGIGAHS
ncbi:hypothetical protein DFJ43DRAFT_1158928 [Lentinula guzmanii]|uniref:Uncharacterized protein n=1 Tax=Lentinula guzmanii TaxID=2804957 RepID=A0AA38J4J3_9AGAR|nr:hypothetical protein DFJ43DRAFT_1158928 [Lentinula guzmanii]